MIKNIMKNIGAKPVKTEEKEKPSTDIAYLKGSEDPQLKADVKKAISTHHATGNNLLNVLYNKDKELYKKLDAMGTTNAEQFINQLAYGEEETTEEKEPFLIQGITKDKYIPWRMDAHGETKAQAESAWNHAEEQAKNKGNDYDHSALRG